MAWVVPDIEPFVSNTRQASGLVSLHGGLYRRRTVTIDGSSSVEVTVTITFGKKRKIKWTVHPQRRMQANVDSRRRRNTQAVSFVFGQDFRPWQQTRTYTK